MAPVRLLCICDPRAYLRPSSEIPLFYQRLARDARASSFHLPATAVLDCDFSQPAPIPVAPLPSALSYDDFLDLNRVALEPGEGQDKAAIATCVSVAYTANDFDLIFCRTLKPFPPGYLQQLSRWEQFANFVNSPTRKIEQLQPEFLLQVAAEYLPDTIVTNDAGQAQAFFERHRTIVAKRSNSCGGRGVFKIWYQDRHFRVDNLNSGLQMFSSFNAVMAYIQSQSSEPMQLMRYLNRVDAGDKRILVVDGEIYGAFVRRSKSGYWVNNISGDGECYPAEVGDGEREAIANTVGEYRDRGLLTLGYDFLQDEDGSWRISEINVGNIGGFARLETLTHQPILQRFISWLIQLARSMR